jgi:hypothetical protein
MLHLNIYLTRFYVFVFKFKIDERTDHTQPRDDGIFTENDAAFVEIQIGKILIIPFAQKYVHNFPSSARMQRKKRSA